MRVALIYTAVGSRRGGAEKYVGVLARALHTAMHEVHVLARDVDEGELPVGIRFHPIRPRALPGLRSLRPLQFAAAAARALAHDSFDLVIGFCPLWGADVHVALNGCRPALLDSSQNRFRRAGMRAAWRLGKWVTPRQWVYHEIERQQFSASSSVLVIAPSRRVAGEFIHWHEISEDRLAVVPLGIELPNASDVRQITRDAFRQRCNLRPDDVAVLFAARNYSLKGLEPLLHAFATTARSASQARLLVCGSHRDGCYRRLADRLGIGDRVRFLGFVDEVRECFTGVDVFAMPTFYDACSLVVLEALAAGLPVVTTRMNGASELVSDGVDGFVVDSPWQTSELSRRLDELISDAVLRRKMGDHACANAERLSIHSSVRKLLDVLEKRKGLTGTASTAADVTGWRRAA